MLNRRSLDILYSILDRVENDFPDIRFMWKYHMELGDYYLLCRGSIEPYECEEFEDLINEKYITQDLANEFFNINANWLCVGFGGDEVIDGVDVEETEIIINKIQHKRRER